MGEAMPWKDCPTAGDMDRRAEGGRRGLAAGMGGSYALMSFGRYMSAVGTLVGGAGGGTLPDMAPYAEGGGGWVDEAGRGAYEVEYGDGYDEP